MVISLRRGAKIVNKRLNMKILFQNYPELKQKNVFSLLISCLFTIMRGLAEKYGTNTGVDVDMYL